MSFRILHVDDEPDIREIVQIALGLDPRFELTSACSGNEALQLLRQCRPQLVLLDMMMPDLDGPATFVAIRNLGYIGLPIVFMTARAQSDQAERLIKLGAAGVIAKPFDPFALAGQLEAYLQ